MQNAPPPHLRPLLADKPRSRAEPTRAASCTRPGDRWNFPSPDLPRCRTPGRTSASPGAPAVGVNTNTQKGSSPGARSSRDASPCRKTRPVHFRLSLRRATNTVAFPALRNCGGAFNSRLTETERSRAQRRVQRSSRRESGVSSARSSGAHLPSTRTGTTPDPLLNQERSRPPRTIPSSSGAKAAPMVGCPAKIISVAG